MNTTLEAQRKSRTETAPKIRAGIQHEGISLVVPRDNTDRTESRMLRATEGERKEIFARLERSGRGAEGFEALVRVFSKYTGDDVEGIDCKKAVRFSIEAATQALSGRGRESVRDAVRVAVEAGYVRDTIAYLAEELGKKRHCKADSLIAASVIAWDFNFDGTAVVDAVSELVRKNPQKYLGETGPKAGREEWAERKANELVHSQHLDKATVNTMASRIGFPIIESG